MRAARTVASILALAGLAAVLPSLASGAQLPETGPEAMAHYESDPDSWLDGPVGYLILEEEKEAFQSLSSTEERRRFIRDFWERRDPDLRDRVNRFKEAFYERVGAANARYHDRPWTGWKSDRGRMHVMLGRPDHVRPRFVGGGGSVEVWTYYTVGSKAEGRPFDDALGEVQIVFFASRRNGSRYNIAGGFAPGVYPNYVREILRYTRLAAVQVADLPY